MNRGVIFIIETVSSVIFLNANARYGLPYLFFKRFRELLDALFCDGHISVHEGSPFNNRPLNGLHLALQLPELIGAKQMA